ncbi:hypothetical protein DL95DRAFT_455156 [Leptodontidium sp. 2 PMI_412]|nr:hypothetical protein DL95DRAFT_455156 [Leptodontidium sp. 2 PMI_412]
MATTEDIVIDMEHVGSSTEPIGASESASKDPSPSAEAKTQAKDTGGRFPYIDNIVERSAQGEGYKTLSRLLMEEFERGSNNGEGYVPPPGGVESPNEDNCAILDVRDGHMSIQSFHSDHGATELQEALRRTPTGQMRAILISVAGLEQVSSILRRQTRYYEYTPLQLELINTLGDVYGVTPLFFEQMAPDRSTPTNDFSMTEQLSRFVLSLGFAYSPVWNEGFAAITATVADKFFSQGTWVFVVILRIPMYYRLYPPDGNTILASGRSDYHNSMAGYGVFSRILWNIRKEGAQNASHLASGHPFNYLLPFFDVMQLEFLHEMLGLRCRLRKWNEYQTRGGSMDMAKHDDELTSSWHRGRAVIEEFQRMHDELLEFLEATASPSTLGMAPNAHFDRFLRKQRGLIQKGRNIEQNVRDTIQVNIGNLALQESRKSIQQADSLGRISFLGFVFLPLSLVMSFFGMNIRQITGTGASWQAFLIAAAVMCVLVILTVAQTLSFFMDIDV